ncbi:hypothetical protein ACSRUE_03145 [Sorangium sp. KYC3313]|uniref:hypothetical protein n=1 Tax=Sorangium sp. KYC3313 TaxID=3449740 RepID=UPI003F88C4A7
MPNPGRIPLMIALGLALPAPAYAQGTQRAPQPRVQSEFSASSVLAFGLTPTAGLGLSPAAALRWSDLSVSLEARALVALGGPPSDLPSGGPRRISAGLGVMSLCRYRDDVFLCNVFQLGAVRASAPESVTQTAGHVLWLLTSGARGGAEWRIARHLQLRSFLELHLVLARPLLSAGPAGRWKTSAVAAIAGIGLTFPVDPG